MTVGRIPVIEGGIQPTIFDAKGDLLTATAADTAARLAVGANGTTLIADSTASTGLKWAASPNFVGCSLTKSANQSLSNNTETAITWNGEQFDTNAFHDNSTNTERITIPAGLGGYYQVSGQITFNTNATGRRATFIRKNGSAVQDVESFGSASNATTNVLSYTIYLAASDYIDVTGFQVSGGSLDVLNSSFYSNLSVIYLGA
jgi:hypothetical protein